MSLTDAEISAALREKYAANRKPLTPWQRSRRGALRRAKREAMEQEKRERRAKALAELREKNKALAAERRGER